MDRVTTSLGTHFGPFEVDTADGRVVEVRGMASDPEPAALGASLLDHDQLRVQRPAIRRSWLEGGPGSANDRRGTDPFVEVSWERALDLVSGELARVRDEHGHTSIYGGSYGWSSAGRFHMSGPQIHRFMRQFGGYTDARGTYSASAAEIVVPYIVGIGYHASIAQMTSWSVIAEHTELFVSFGGLRLSNTQVTYGGQGPHHTKEWMRRAVDGGVQFVNVGPLKDDIAPEFSPRWQPIRPGTDVALMLGLVHTLVTEGLADLDFLETRCEGWDRFGAYVLGQTDGVVRSAAWASEITGIHRDDIVELAREMSSKRTLINLGLSVQRADHGEQSYWAAFALAAALGQIGLPGGGVAFPFGAQGNVGAGQRRARVPGMPVPPRPVDTDVISVSRMAELLESPGVDFDYDGERGTYADVRLVYWAGGNPFHHHQDLNRLVAAWERPDTVVVQEPFWTPTARRADVVLPATTPLERFDLGGMETVMVAMTPAVEVLDEARDDYWIFSQLAQRLGFAEQFTEGRTADQWVEVMYELYRADRPDAPPYEEFMRDGHLLHAGMTEMGAARQVYLEDFVGDPDAHPLPTKSGRIELFSTTIESFDYDDCPPHPAFLEPYERIGGELGDRFPLHLVSNQPAGRLHSQYDHGRVSQATKVAGREPARLHPSTAAARNIGDGDVIRVFNDRGACLAGAVIDDAVMPEAVQLSTGAWYDPDPDGMCRAGNPNVLTRDKGTSKLAQGPTAHTCVVEVERWQGPAPRVEVYDLPEIIPEG